MGGLVGIAERVSLLAQIFLLIWPFWKDSLKEASGKIRSGGEAVASLKQTPCRVQDKLPPTCILLGRISLLARQCSALSCPCTPWISLLPTIEEGAVDYGFLSLLEQSLHIFIICTMHISKVSTLPQHP